MGDACLRFQTDVSPSHKGHRWEVIRLHRFSEYTLSNSLLSDLLSEDFEQWADLRLKTGVKGSTVNRELNLISSVINHAKKWKWCRVNPISDMDRPMNPCPRDRRISNSEIERILDALGYSESEQVSTQRQESAVAFLLALETAMRQGEIWGLDWSNVDLKNRFVTLPKTKNGTKRDVPLTLRAVSLVEKLTVKTRGRVFKYNQQSSGAIFRRALYLADIKSLTFHDTRHEALTRLARKLDVLDLARMVGHRDPRSLMIYYNATASEIAQRLD